MRQGSCEVGPEGCVPGLREVVAEGLEVGLGWNMRERGVYPEKAHAPGICIILL